VSEAVAETGLPVFVIGKGSNLLVSDAGYSGIALRLGRGYRWAARDVERLTAGGAMPLPALAGVALSHGLTGLEFTVAIPATVGGAVRMNAGAHGREMAQVLEAIEVFDLGLGATRHLRAQEAGFRYRGSVLPQSSVVTGISCRLAAGSEEEIRRRMEEAREWRRATQPLAEPNCGSVFKNPPEDRAARLIEMAGAKELRVGNAAVSAKHANFIVARPGSTASDVIELIRNVQELVAARTGIHLETEVHLVGDFDLIPH
jgi:UDP-N-acetylmuramate dehydrogenase